ncbi:MAG TPA: asparagine synthetase B [Gaiellaceae bacterium]|nr:asparagine synthetase B [Gaiellaceae bacterium]
MLLGGEPRLPLAPGVLDRMTDAMLHRGPDDRGTYEAPGVALGARRLSIVDVAGGHQPVGSEDGTVWAMQNGELYNHEALRAELDGGHRFRSRCDTEILPHLYEQHGPRFPSRLRTKHLLKEAARGLVPDPIIDKRKIGFFRGATRAWIDAQVDGALRDYLLAPAPRYAAFLDPGVVGELVEAHRSGRDRSRVQLLLAVLMLEVWLSTALPHSIEAPVELRPGVHVPA